MEMALTFGPLATGIAAIMWIAIAIRCSVCGGRIGWYVIAHRPASTWITDLWHACHCPSCRDDGRGDAVPT
jgi:hypothetical protein